MVGREESRQTFRWQVIGHSIEGRDIRRRTVGSGPRVVLWVDGIHGNEPENAVSTAALPAAFLAAPERAARVQNLELPHVIPHAIDATSSFNPCPLDV